jgi:hypothetical protein
MLTVSFTLFSFSSCFCLLLTVFKSHYHQKMMKSLFTSSLPPITFIVVFFPFSFRKMFQVKSEVKCGVADTVFTTSKSEYYRTTPIVCVRWSSSPYSSLLCSTLAGYAPTLSPPSIYRPACPVYIHKLAELLKSGYGTPTTGW